MFKLMFNLDAFARRINELGRADKRAESVAKRAALLLFQDSTQSFLRQADPVTGRKWQPSRRARKQHGQTLLDTRRLSRSILAFAEKQERGKLAIVGKAGVVYARTHQFGDPSRHIPQRRFMGLSRQSIEMIRQLFESAVRGDA